MQGSCGISKPFEEPERLAEYLANGDLTKLRRRLEADVKSLFALYEYGRLHGIARLRWGFLDERIPAPWVHRDEPVLNDLEKEAFTLDVPLEVVVGSAPGWDEPWSRARYAHVESGGNAWQYRLVDDAGSIIDELDVQRARICPNGVDRLRTSTNGGIAAHESDAFSDGSSRLASASLAPSAMAHRPSPSTVMALPWRRNFAESASSP